MSLVEMWKKVQHSNIVQLREVFTSNAFGEHCKLKLFILLISTFGEHCYVEIIYIINFNLMAIVCRR